MEDRVLRESNRTPGGELRFVDLVDLEELRALCESVIVLTGAVTEELIQTESGTESANEYSNQSASIA